jgi:enoyl-CoA hydratase/carnithine racemase
MPRRKKYSVLKITGSAIILQPGLIYQYDRFPTRKQRAPFLLLRLSLKIESLPQPLNAAIKGYALGLGFELALGS